MRIWSSNSRAASAAAAPRTSPPAKASAAKAGSPSLAQRLHAQWARDVVAPVSDAELAGAVDALFEHHRKNGFFGTRCEGMQRIRGLGASGQLEVELGPNRANVPVARHSDGCDCDLCTPPIEDERGLRWRDFVVWPNAYPYVPTESRHVVISAAEHRLQGHSPKLLADLIDYQRCAQGKRQLTLHYNGVAGNSQLHWHWQATREVLPLQRLLDAGKMSLEEIVRRPGGRVSTYDQGPFAGILVSGQRSFVVSWAGKIVERLDADPATRGAYNMLLLQPRGGETRLVIVPRRADALRPSFGSLGSCSLGAFNVGGIVALPSRSLPSDFSEVCEAGLRETVVPPRELGWLRELAASAGADLLGAA